MSALTGRQRRETLDLLTLVLSTAALPVLPIVAGAPTYFTVGTIFLCLCLAAFLLALLVDVLAYGIDGDQ